MRPKPPRNTDGYREMPIYASLINEEPNSVDLGHPLRVAKHVVPPTVRVDFPNVPVRVGLSEKVADYSPRPITATASCTANVPLLLIFRPSLMIDTPPLASQ